MRKTIILCCVLAAVFIGPVSGAAQHTIQWQNHCNYPIWVDVQGGLQYTLKGSTYGACSCLPDNTCSPTTRCDNTGCGPDLNPCDKGTPLVDGGGFRLDANTGTHTTPVEENWQGAFWGRTGCSGSDDDLTCDWGTCRSNIDGKGKLQCGGVGLSPPSTKGEINFDQGGHDTYDVSIVDGFNVPMAIEVVKNTGKTGSEPKGKEKYDCTMAGTHTDIRLTFNETTLNFTKLANIQNGKMVGVWSACSWASPPNPEDPRMKEYCCINPYGSRQDAGKHGGLKCDPSTWPAELNTAAFFKKYLPGSYSYAYDDDASTFQCMNKDANTWTSYLVTFCGESEPPRIDLPGSDTHSHLPDMSPTPLPTPVPTQTPVPVQTAVPSAPYNPATYGDVNF